MKRLTLALVLVSTPLFAAGDDAAVVATIKKRMPSFKLCFDDAVERKGFLEGKVTIDFEIGADGRVTTSRVSSDNIRDPEVGCCAALKMRGLKFDPPSSAPVRMSYPFVFINPNRGAKPPKNPPAPTTYCKDLKAQTP